MLAPILKPTINYRDQHASVLSEYEAALRRSLPAVRDRTSYDVFSHRPTEAEKAHGQQLQAAKIAQCMFLRPSFQGGLIIRELEPILDRIKISFPIEVELKDLAASAFALSVARIDAFLKYAPTVLEDCDHATGHDMQSFNPKLFKLKDIFNKCLSICIQRNTAEDKEIELRLLATEIEEAKERFYPMKYFGVTPITSSFNITSPL